VDQKIIGGSQGAAFCFNGVLFGTPRSETFGENPNSGVIKVPQKAIFHERDRRWDMK